MGPGRVLSRRWYLEQYEAVADFGDNVQQEPKASCWSYEVHSIRSDATAAPKLRHAELSGRCASGSSFGPASEWGRFLGEWLLYLSCSTADSLRFVCSLAPTGCLVLLRSSLLHAFGRLQLRRLRPLGV